ncbi:MAG TPA: hypothetical protein VGI33_19490 [Paenibacillus sp.]|jgi:hypothetical protein
MDENPYLDHIGLAAESLIAAHFSVKYSSQIRTVTMLSMPVFPLNLPEIKKTLLDVLL